ncbi:MAG: YdcF family protein [Vicinamibacterales bacterium]
MAQIGWFVFSGGGAITLLALAGIWAAWSGSARSRTALLLLALFYWVSSTEAVADALRRVMAAPYAPLAKTDVPPGRTAVVLLGSGGWGVRDWSENQLAVVDRIGAARLLEAARVFRLVGADYIVSSGGVGVVSQRARASGRVMADVLLRLGIPADRIVLETESHNTHDEAVIIQRMLQSRPVDHLVLVTSQFHMRRSVGTFRAVGLEVIPAVAREPESIDTWWGKLIPTDKAMDDTALAAHEVMGMLVYAARGWYRRQ